MEKANFGRALPIWTNDRISADQKILIRKTFSLDSVPERADTLIACDTKFWLWVNGRPVIYEGGVFRESKKGCGYAEKVDLAPYLKQGKNCLSALVWFYGNGGRNSVNSKEAGFLLASDALGLYSDRSFLVSAHTGYGKTNPPYPSYLYGGDNIGFRAAEDPGRFWEPDFDESEFVPATVYETSSWGDSYLSPLPPIKVFPEKELPFERTDDGATASLPYAMTLSVCFVLEGNGDETIDIRTDRYEVNGGPGDEMHSYRGHRIEYITKKGENSFRCPMYLYGEKLILTFPDTVTLKKLSYVESGYDTELLGKFETDDPVFNRLIEKCARTLCVCMRNNFMDCPDRERGQWIGDVSVQAPQVFFLYDRNAQKLLKKAICDFVNLRDGDRLIGNVPGETSSELPSQSLLALSEYGMVGEYYHYTHDAEIPDLILKPGIAYLKLWDTDKNGLLIPREGDWRWFDHLYNIDDTVLENCMYVSACRFLLKMAETAGDREDAAFLSARIATVSDAVERNFWNGTYYTSGAVADERANAWAILSGICPQERFSAVRKILLSVCNATPYMERFVLLALCQIGDIRGAYERMMKRYCVLATNENSTLWEDFHLLGTRNHAWSGCPVEIAFKYFLGLKTEDCFRTVTVSPAKGIFKTIRYAIPTQNGVTEGEIS